MLCEIRQSRQSEALYQDQVHVEGIVSPVSFDVHVHSFLCHTCLQIELLGKVILTSAGVVLCYLLEIVHTFRWLL